MTFGSLVESYGGWAWPPAVRGAKATAAKCARMGGKWIQVDEWSGLVLFSKIKHQHRERFEESWAEYRKYADKSSSASSGLALGSSEARPASEMPANSGEIQQVVVPGAAEGDAKSKAESEAKSKAEREAKAKAEREAKAKAEREAKAKGEAGESGVEAKRLGQELKKSRRSKRSSKTRRPRDPISASR